MGIGNSTGFRKKRQGRAGQGEPRTADLGFKDGSYLLGTRGAKTRLPEEMPRGAWLAQLVSRQLLISAQVII